MAHAKDWTGEQIGEWTVISKTGEKQGRHYLWECHCNTCGNTKLLRPSTLAYQWRTRGRVSCKSCSRTRDYTGTRYGYLVCTEPTKQEGTSGEFKWKMQCDCGREVTRVPSTQKRNMKQGRAPSCGCIANGRNYVLGDYQSWWTCYKRSAFSRQLEWDLLPEEFTKIILQPCNYCGHIDTHSIKSPTRYRGAEINGMDRVDNTQGYNPDNCVPCCTICNKAKNSLSLEDWNAWLDRITSHQLSLRTQVPHLDSAS